MSSIRLRFCIDEVMPVSFCVVVTTKGILVLAAVAPDTDVEFPLGCAVVFAGAFEHKDTDAKDDEENSWDEKSQGCADVGHG